MHPAYFLLGGFVFLMTSGVLLAWTTVFRSRATPEPIWITPVGIGTWVASFLLFFVGIVTTVPHLTN